MTPLQASSIFWFVPTALYAHWCGEQPLAFVVIVVAATSMMVHRRNRTVDTDVSDWLDIVALSAWVTCNTIIAADIDNTSITGLKCSASAFVCCLAVAALNVVRQKAGPWQSTSRRVVHSAMHGVGVAGTLFLLAAPKRPAYISP